MNILTPVSNIMTRDLFTVHPKDNLYKVKEIFDTYNIHHIPVVEFRKIRGIISKTDLLYFLKGMKIGVADEDISNSARLSHHIANDIMTTKMVTLDAEEPIRTAIDVFKENLFHAIPIVTNDELVGILTTYDLIASLAEEMISLSDYKMLKK